MKRNDIPLKRKRNEITQKRNEINNKTFRQKKLVTPCSDLIILFLCASPVAIENITAQVQDVDISTAHWAQFTFRQPRYSAFYKTATCSITFFLQKNLMI
jgi:hypothetical protein